MSARRGSTPLPAATDGGRVQREQVRRRRRRRRFVRGTIRLVMWTLVLGAVFILGIGFGRTVGGGSTAGTHRTVTIRNDRGVITATLPTTTIVKTVVSTKTVKVKARKHRAG